MRRADAATTTSENDHGFTLIELIIVIVVMGILLIVIVSAVFGVTGTGTERGCETDSRSLKTAVESYFVVYRSDSVAAADASPDRYEITLVNAGLIREPSELHDLTVDGEVVAASDSPC